MADVLQGSEQIPNSTFRGITEPIESLNNCIMVIANSLNLILGTQSNLTNTQIRQKLSLPVFQNSGYPGLRTTPLNFDDSGAVRQTFTWTATSNTTVLAISWFHGSVTFFVPPSFTWPTDGSTTPATVKQNVKNYVTIASALEAVSALLIIASLYINIRFRNHPVIRHSSAYFNNLIIVGATINYLSIPSFLELTRNTMALGCLARVWLPLIGFSLMWLAIIVKNLRVWYIFSFDGKIEAWKLSSLISTIPLAILMIVNVAFISYWTSQVWTVFQLSISGDIATTTCIFGNTYTIVPLATFNALLLLSLPVLSYLTRNIPSTHSESVFLLLNFAFYLFAGVSVIPEIKLSQKWLKGIYAGAGIWVATTFTVGIYFGGKMLQLLREYKAGLAVRKKARGFAVRVSNSIRASVARASVASIGGGSILKKSYAALFESKGALAVVVVDGGDFGTCSFNQIGSAISSNGINTAGIWGGTTGGGGGGGCGGLTVDLGDRAHRLSISSIGGRSMGGGRSSFSNRDVVISRGSETGYNTSTDNFRGGIETPPQKANSTLRSTAGIIVKARPATSGL
ncbi:hypothetical protein BDR26DRAFT_430615 [Obelidium mucronatum]|nr:hypothetical protein BDR26DRAFT_430615 [Obelidium mucronatum]